MKFSITVAVLQWPSGEMHAALGKTETDALLKILEDIRQDESLRENLPEHYDLTKLRQKRPLAYSHLTRIEVALRRLGFRVEYFSDVEMFLRDVKMTPA